MGFNFWNYGEVVTYWGVARFWASATDRSRARGLPLCVHGGRHRANGACAPRLRTAAPRRHHSRLGSAEEASEGGFFGLPAPGLISVLFVVLGAAMVASITPRRQEE